MRFVLGILNPRQLPFFLKSLKRIDYVDVLMIKNMELKLALETVKEQFLKRNYDYLMLMSDDFIIPYLAPAKIMQDVEVFKYPIITGWSRIDPSVSMTNISIKRATSPGKYRLMNIHQVTDLLLKGTYIVCVWFLGWSLTAMSRKVVKNWTPRGWGRWGTAERIDRADLWFSDEATKKGFRMYADLTVHIPHFKVKRKNFRVGIDKPKVELIKAKKRLIR